MDIAGVAKDHAVGLDAEPIEIIIVARPWKKNLFVRARPENEFGNLEGHKSIEPIHDHGDASRGSDKAAILARVGKVRRNFYGMGTRQFFEGSAQVYLENEFLVVFEMNKERERAKARELLAEKAHIFPGRPRVHDIGRASIFKNTGPVPIDFGKAADGIILFA